MIINPMELLTSGIITMPENIWHTCEIYMRATGRVSVCYWINEPTEDNTNYSGSLMLNNTNYSDSIIVDCPYLGPTLQLLDIILDDKKGRITYFEYVKACLEKELCLKSGKRILL
ncbi:hypothetical protein QUF31_20495 [Dickeya chrysanthemi]|uniref:hypothetical protein n=1 Tax=Dickeya chrysanthemi TaxID=556 RepID=UPI0025A2A804|nr:hypothetical protein [Dickeya chrysanthemi]WJM85418.1 hypothetical protein QUF31_20495 [Dickeya chrysanthemi]